jgi:hypothetical protein
MDDDMDTKEHAVVLEQTCIHAAINMIATDAWCRI